MINTADKTTPITTSIATAWTDKNNWTIGVTAGNACQFIIHCMYTCSIGVFHLIS